MLEPENGTKQLAMRHVWVVMFAFGALALLGLILYNTLRLDGKYTPDSLFYIDAARNLLGGRGLVSSMAELDRLMAADQGLPVPFTLWAPLYPLAVAAVSAVGMPATAAAFVVSVVGYGGVLLGGFLVARRLAGPAAGALAVGLLAHMPPLSIAAQTAWSETLGLALLLCALWLSLPAAQETDEKRAWTCFIGGIFAGLAFATRYALFPIVIVGPAILLVRYKRQGLRLAFFCAAGSAIPLLPVMVRNFTAAGLPSGAGTSNEAVLFYENLLRIWPALHASLWQDGFAFNAIAITIVIVIGAAVAWRRRSGLQTAYSAQVFWRSAAILACWAAVYLGFLLAAQLRVRVDPLNARLLLPMTIVVPPLVAAGIIHAGLPRRAAAIFAALFLGLSMYTQAADARLIAGTRLPPVYDVSTRMPKGTISWLAEHVQPGDFIVAKDGLDLPLYLGPLNTAFFSEAHTPGFLPTPEALFAYLDRYACDGGAVWLIIGNYHSNLTQAERERVEIETTFEDHLVLRYLCHGETHAE